MIRKFLVDRFINEGIERYLLHAETIEQAITLIKMGYDDTYVVDWIKTEGVVRAKLVEMYDDIWWVEEIFV
jgi:hypothetical protein